MSQTFRWSEQLLERVAPHGGGGEVEGDAEMRAMENVSIAQLHRYTDAEGVHHQLDVGRLRGQWCVATAAAATTAATAETAVCTCEVSGVAALRAVSESNDESAALLHLGQLGELDEMAPLVPAQRHRAGEMPEAPAVLALRTMLCRDASSKVLRAPLEVSVVEASVPSWGEVRTAAWHLAMRCTLCLALDSAVGCGAHTLE